MGVTNTLLQIQEIDELSTSRSTVKQYVGKHGKYSSYFEDLLLE